MTLIRFNCRHLAVTGGNGARRNPHRCLSVYSGLCVGVCVCVWHTNIQAGVY